MVAVISASGKRLMPTSERKARKLLKSGRAEIHAYRPVFTIRLLDREDGYTQPIEYCCDTGYQHIGISIKSEKREYVNEQRDLLSDETERHNDRRKYRTERRNRKTRYRKARFSNRKNLIAKDGFAPSIRNKRNVHIALYEGYCRVIPITKATFEMGQFDPQVLKALEEEKPIPEGKAYQQGERYGYATLREAVFARDQYACICCGKSAVKDGVILKLHHLGYRLGDRSNRMSNLGSVCDKCHTSKNHKPGGKLYELNPKLKSFKGASFMTSVKYSMIKLVRKATPDVEISITYGAMTKLKRKELGLEKAHSNDAYAMGEFHPEKRAGFSHYKKVRRNNRILSKFYDAKYIDIRDGKKKSGSQLGCNRTGRSIPRNNPQNERIYRGEKLSKGRVSTRRMHYQLRPGDTVLFEGRKYVVNGMQNGGAYVSLEGRNPVSLKKVIPCCHTGGWLKVS